MKINPKLIKEEIVLNEIKPTNMFEDGKRVYVKKISGALSGTGLTDIPCGLSGVSYTPIDYSASFNAGGASIFQSNTPRGTGTNVDNTQLYSYWNFASDKLVAVSNGFDRTGTIVNAKLYFTYN